MVIPIGMKLIATHDILKELDDIEGWEEWGYGSQYGRLQSELNDLRREKMGLVTEAYAGITWVGGQGQGGSTSVTLSLLEHRQSCGSPYFEKDEHGYEEAYLRIRYVRLKEIGFTQSCGFFWENLRWNYTLRLIEGHLNFATPVIWEKGVAKKVTLKQDGIGESEAAIKPAIDIGLEYKQDEWNLAVICSNLGSPKFSYPIDAHLDNYLIEPQVKILAGFKPLKNLALVMYCDLTQNETLLEGYKSMLLACGAEKAMFHGKLMLRAGIAKNLLEDDIGCVYSFGIGSKIACLQLNMDGAISSKATKRSKTSRYYPAQIQTCLQISGQF